MTKQELAAELYDLIVNRGRWKGKAENRFFGNSYAELPEWMQHLWNLKAIEFAAENRFTLED